MLRSHLFYIYNQKKIDIKCRLVYNIIYKNLYNFGKNNMEKELEVGKTLLGVTVAEYKGRIVPIKVYYGNYVTAKDKGDIQLKIDGEFIHQKPELYLKLLRDFLNSEEGRNYKVPTKDEVQAAVAKVLADEETRKTEERKPIENIVPKEEPKEVPIKKLVYIKDFEDDEVDGDEDDFEPKRKERNQKKGKITKEQMDELTLMYKRQANILTIAVIFLVLVVALQMLLNLYLLTR